MTKITKYHQGLLLATAIGGVIATTSLFAAEKEATTAVAETAATQSVTATEAKSEPEISSDKTTAATDKAKTDKTAKAAEEKKPKKEGFVPTESISEDLAVSFPIDI